MIHDLELLIELQKVDVRIYQLIQSQADLPKTLSDLEEVVTKAKNTLDAVSQKIATLEADKKSIATKVVDAKGALDKSQDRLNSIKTNREYDAVHAEIETFKSVISGADGKIKAIDAEIEKQLKALEEATAAYEKTKTDNEAQINEIKTKLASIESSVDVVKEERAKIAATVPKSALRIYEHILARRKNGIVLSFVKSGKSTCSSCFKVLETQLVSEIRRGSRIQVCQNCGSIFVWGETKLDDSTSTETPTEIPKA
jgi:uncharacterized protein